MRTRCLVTIAASALLWSSALFTEVPRACDCMRLPPPSPAVRSEADYIFEGRALEIVERTEHTARTRSGGAQTEVRPIDRQVVFEVRRAWRGVSTERVSVTSMMSDCMFPFEIGRDYLVFAHKDSTGRPATSICQRTRPSGGAGNVISHLGAPSFVPQAGK